MKFLKVRSITSLSWVFLIGCSVFLISNIAVVFYLDYQATTSSHFLVSKPFVPNQIGPYRILVERAAKGQNLKSVEMVKDDFAVKKEDVTKPIILPKSPVEEVLPPEQPESVADKVINKKDTTLLIDVPNPINLSHEVPKDGFAGCLVLKDDNDRLAEWLAYHWLVLPLKYLVVAIDPTGTTSPKSILDLWANSEMGLDIVLWNDSDFGHWIDEDMDELHRHRDRQKRLISECQKYHWDKGRTWVAIIDPDEYITYNFIEPDDPPPDEPRIEETPPEYEEPAYIREMKKLRERLPALLQEGKTIFDFINENKDIDPWKSEPCHLMPRLLFSAVESRPQILAKSEVEKFGFNNTKFSTLRYFHHSRKGGFHYNHYGKVIIDLSRIRRKEIHHNMYSIHRPLNRCLAPLKPYNLGIFRVHHYLGSWEQYFSRADTRRSKAKFDDAATVDKGVNYQLQPWLKRFVTTVGVEKSAMLLQSAGIIQKGKVAIINTTEYVKVEMPEKDRRRKKREKEAMEKEETEKKEKLKDNEEVVYYYYYVDDNTTVNDGVIVVEAEN